jgi:hypothetical protein
MDLKGMRWMVMGLILRDGFSAATCAESLARRDLRRGGVTAFISFGRDNGWGRDAGQSSSRSLVIAQPGARGPN